MEIKENKISTDYEKMNKSSERFSLASGLIKILSYCSLLFGVTLLILEKYIIGVSLISGAIILLIFAMFIDGFKFFAEAMYYNMLSNHSRKTKKEIKDDEEENDEEE